MVRPDLFDGFDHAVENTGLICEGFNALMSAWLELFRLVGGGAQMRPAYVYRDDCSHRHNYTVGKQLTQLKQIPRTGLSRSRGFFNANYSNRQMAQHQR